MMLIARLAGGEVVRGVVDNYPKPQKSRLIDFKVEKANRFLGTSLSREIMARYLRALEMGVETVDDQTLRVYPPSFRVDITRDWDLMEEVARLEGYDNIPVTAPPIKPSEHGDAPELIASERIRDVMVGMGYTEIISYSFVSDDSADLLGVEADSPLRSYVKLLNPLTSDQSVMRTSLLPGLLGAVKTNISHGERDLKLFEWGKLFVQRDQEELPEERHCLCAVITGLANPKEWYREERPVDFYDIKGSLEALLKALGLREYQFRLGKTPSWYEQSASCVMDVAGARVGNLGQLSQGVLSKFDLDAEAVYLFELDGTLFLEKITGKKHFESLARYPAVLRDISLVVNRRVDSGTVQGIIRRVGGELVESVTLFDVYEGGKMEPSEKALAFRICYRSKERTLDGKEVNRLHETIVGQIGVETGGRLREG
jgi:phenylalanyl-tRNA synthetase beta chain